MGQRVAERHELPFSAFVPGSEVDQQLAETDRNLVRHGSQHPARQSSQSPGELAGHGEEQLGVLLGHAQENRLADRQCPDPLHRHALVGRFGAHVQQDARAQDLAGPEDVHDPLAPGLGDTDQLDQPLEEEEHLVRRFYEGNYAFAGAVFDFPHLAGEAFDPRRGHIDERGNPSKELRIDHSEVAESLRRSAAAGPSRR